MKSSHNYIKTFEIEFRDNGDLESICKLLAGEDFFDEF